MKAADLTLRAVTRQLRSMSALKFELGVLTPEGKMLLRDFDYHQVVKSIAWLKKMNTGGSEIYIRPKGSVGIILMDDIDLGVLKLLKDNSLSPACVVETSPQNLQAWIRFSVKPVSEQTATAVAQFLAHKYNADFNSADWRHFGRLAGFTNRKTLHIDELGKSPYVLLQEYKGTQIANGQELVRRALKWHEDYTAEKNKSDGLLVISTHPPSKDALKYFESVYASLEARFGKPLKNRPGNVFGESEADFVVCLKMLQAGYDRETVASTLLACSPNLDTRKKGHINNYIKLTLDATGKMFV